MITRVQSILRRCKPHPIRSLALASGLLFIGSFLSVFYHIVDIVGNVSWLISVVVVALSLATVCARLVSGRVAAALGVSLLTSGVAMYVWFAPFDFQTVFTIEFLVDLAAYLTGISVLGFKRIDVWTVAVAPAPVFLTWYFFLRRQYDRGVVIGGVTLIFFVLTGDAAWSTTLLGSISTLGVLSLSELDETNWSWKQIEDFGLVLVVVTLVSQVLRNVDGVAAQNSHPGGYRGESSVESSLVEADNRIRVFDQITLSPEVRFTVTTDAPDFLHAGSYDRYTGDGWIRSGQATPYEDQLSPPPGETTTVEQTFRAKATAKVIPAAWKPVRISGNVANYTEVTSTGGFMPEKPLLDGDEYTVVSYIPDTTPERLRSVDGGPPDEISRRYLQLPESTPGRIHRKAREIVSDAPTLYDAVSTVKEWLRENKTYSLEVDRPNDNIADAFIFGMDRGYCVYFATAMTVLLRSLDIPARFVNGYLPGERVEDDKWVIRGYDSHAWTEVYFSDVGWVPFDPTPPDRRRNIEQERLEEARNDGTAGVDTDETRPVRATSTPTEAGNSTQDRNTSPTSSMNNGTRNSTSLLAADTGPGSRSMNPRDNRSDKNSGSEGRVSTSLPRVERLTLIASLAGIIIGVHKVRLLKRGYREFRLRRQRPTESPNRDVKRAFERLEHLLERRYRPRESGETPRQYLENLEPGIDSRAHAVLRHYENAYYAETISRDEADEAIRLVDELVNPENRAD